MPLTYPYQVPTPKLKFLDRAAAIRAWLKAPDATINHNAACEKRLTSTGSWFVEGQRFAGWLEEPNSFLWINGLAGSGKSILCSTAIEHTKQVKQYGEGAAVVYFYFSFEDHSKQGESSMLRALLLQLAEQHVNGMKTLEELYGMYQNGTPPVVTLMSYLQRLMTLLPNVFILLDALDECPRSTARESLLDCLEKMRKWSLPYLHLLVTSRFEMDIYDSLNAEDQIVTMENAAIEEDIATYITSQLAEDKGLQKWERFYEKIRSTLTAKAEGM